MRLVERASTRSATAAAADDRRPALVRPPSLRLLACMVRRLEGMPMPIVPTLRANEPDTDRALLAELAQDRPPRGSFCTYDVAREPRARSATRLLAARFLSPARRG